MGAGDRYMQPKFTVPMAGKGDWPFKSKSEQKRIEAQTGTETCGECGASLLPGAPIHMDIRDAGRPKRRVCFGKVIAR